jgi:16S rRNA (cytosine967-C5)-methyltransferase
MVVQSFLTTEETARLLDVGMRLDAMEAERSLHADGARLLRETAVRDGCLQILPGVLPCDGFFAAVLMRT